MKIVAIIDYGMCNLDSVFRAVEECGGFPIVTDQSCEIATATHIILPGVGAFPEAMRNIRERSLDEILYKYVIVNETPFLGICLGMQLLATRSWENEETQGLGWIEGDVCRFKPLDGRTRIPHIGWNEVHFAQDSQLFENIPSGKDFYFVHSYHFCCTHEEYVLARTPYCGEFVSVIGRDLIFATQFHPEKSQKVGFRILKNFLSLQ